MMFISEWMQPGHHYKKNLHRSTPTRQFPLLDSVGSSGDVLAELWQNKRWMSPATFHQCLSCLMTAFPWGTKLKHDKTSTFTNYGNEQSKTDTGQTHSHIMEINKAKLTHIRHIQKSRRSAKQKWHMTDTFTNQVYEQTHSQIRGMQTETWTSKFKNQNDD